MNEIFKKLCEDHERTVDEIRSEYIIDLNGTQAAIRAGYSESKTPVGFYVYFLINPITNRIFYIGKGSGGRVYSHAKNAIKNIGNPYNIKEIKSIIDAGENVKEFILENNLDEDVSLSIEKNLIFLLKNTGLSNISNGVVSSKDACRAKAKILLNEIIGYNDWIETAGNDVLGMARRIFGSTEKAYNFVYNGLKESSYGR